MDGGFDAMNTFVRETICHALEASHQHYEKSFEGGKQGLLGKKARLEPIWG